MNWISWPITIQMNPNAVTINGVEITYMVLAQIINEITNPDPRKWIRMERVGDAIHITIRMSEESDGSQINTLGQGETDHGGERAEAPHPPDAHTQSS